MKAIGRWLWTASVWLTGDSRLTLWIEDRYCYGLAKSGRHAVVVRRDWRREVHEWTLDEVVEDMRRGE